MALRTANILVLHGPNVSLIGERPGDDPSWSLGAIDRALQERARALGVTLKVVQTNHEGVLIDALHRERKWADGVLLNPGALAHYSYALRDAIATVRKPVVEVHLSDLNKREPFRRTSVLADVVQKRVMGLGPSSYLVGLEALLGGAAPSAAGAPAKAALGPKAGRASAPVAAPPKKPLGRKGAATALAATPAKTLGKKAELGKTPGSVAAGTSAPGKTLGRARGGSSEAPGTSLSRKLVRQKIADRLSGRLTTAGLATWARAQWLEIQRGAAAEAGQRDLLDDTLQTLTLSGVPTGKLSDEQLVELMAQLGE